MARRKKGAVRTGRGAMCNICGRNCGKGGPLKTHVEGAHKVNYDDYKKCFEGTAQTVLTDAWDDSGVTVKGDPVIVHVLARKFIGDPAWPKVTRSVPKKP